ncbi:DEAD/DEAH box helicase [Pectobacterium brasiliense]|uniref:DNA 3'-5' helicase n=1 Tax=Pectobacterium brasiliense TaxID=180957 RepID=A0A433NAQ1_9GAMM|nr:MULTISPECIES: DEAD/DEAH box helicase [Pectobacterium]GKW28825.1 ATP-dependent DNA helicase RecQ [Pectobacterium carotovorum subsp. carotovorum]MBN3048268.1 RecQ family ATP-dependent DNA helicase [Pectobacterium brasiliense]MBN3075651.1 RecQ family ATP-dependent DNA helicase [Pectobacterium brasiliense]MBN3084806.1 RecQ family ATP-dependent DNA helicase [Pectobacterium brasiliense]MBN3091160.1 RecQ family ATP-dependent DNA helicase [Pectobacterium brasiliense]
MDQEQARQLLQTALANPAAQFREGQWEAIDALVNRQQKLLVVQRTGWGKSSVYFISTKIFRDRGMGPTIIVSPLLALMRNQIDSAGRLGIVAETLNSTNKSEWENVTQRVLRNQVDCLLISPERLANDSFVETVLQPIADRIALMVIDEAHCISDWGHDFRPDYRRIVNILRQLPANTPVLGTTATANNRVVDDIQAQLGSIHIQRGPLIRKSLSLQTMKLPDQSSRLAWLAQAIPTLQGTGIVYVLTQRDAEIVSDWLNQSGRVLNRPDIVARPYYSGVSHDGFMTPTGKPDSDGYRQHLESLLLNNQIKVLVATTALGMGYDKPDLGFVIHYQMPGSVVAYYQQVGRAGRGIEQAVGILLSGAEDEEIHKFFRRSAFPAETQVTEILQALANADGLTLREIEEHTNLRHGQIEKVLKFLSVDSPAPVIKIDKKWRRTPIPYQMDRGRIAHLTGQREREWQEMQAYLAETDCKMTFLRRALDDNDPTPCGQCETCLGRPIIDLHANPFLAIIVDAFLGRSETVISPKTQIAANSFIQYGFHGNLPSNLRAQEGRVLSRWGESGCGKMVAIGKRIGHFNSELVRKMAVMIQHRWKPIPAPAWVCCVPSLHNSKLVPDFAQRLAKQLNLPFVDAIHKIRDNQPQKNQQNRFHQCRNLDGAFAVLQSVPEGPVLLVDDIIDSGWTLTVIAALLQQAGSGCVYPVALASSSVKDE